jgi:hypothetical protein
MPLPGHSQQHAELHVLSTRVFTGLRVAFEYSRQMPEPLLQQGVKWSVCVCAWMQRVCDVEA